MPYPLGSFPRYGYQTRNAAIRRQVAQENSAATRRVNARYELKIEEAVFKHINVLLSGTTANNPKGEAALADLRFRMDRIRRYHGEGRRVYYRFLGETLRLFYRKAGIKTGLEDVDDEKLKRVVRDFGSMVLTYPEKFLELKEKETI